MSTPLSLESAAARQALNLTLGTQEEQALLGETTEQRTEQAVAPVITETNQEHTTTKNPLKGTPVLSVQSTQEAPELTLPQETGSLPPVGAPSGALLGASSDTSDLPLPPPSAISSDIFQKNFEEFLKDQGRAPTPLPIGDLPRITGAKRGRETPPQETIPAEQKQQPKRRDTKSD